MTIYLCLRLNAYIREYLVVFLLQSTYESFLLYIAAQASPFGMPSARAIHVYSRFRKNTVYE